MQEREDYPAGVPCWIDTGRKDSAAAVDFYGGLFGWEFEDVSPDGAPAYLVASLHGLAVASIGTQPEMDWEPVWNTYIRVENAEETASAVADAGGRTTIEPFALGPAGRMATFDDPQGAGFCIWEPGETRGAQLVNDPGAWVFSALHTDDPDGAQAFYGSVFGWEIGPVDDDGNAMIRKPGYQDFLARKDPELPARLEQYEAPEGFGDVVAQMVALADGASPHWDVTFSVESADASAERAAELGAEIVVEPFDAPWVRAAVLRDPDRVAFTVSQFVPPS